MNKEYIEREECLTELNHIINEYVADNSVQCNIAAGTAIDIRDNVILKLPAADVAPVVHGEWIPIVNYFHGKPDGRYYCSVCHRVETTKGIYCRLCGARMDGGNAAAGHEAG